MSKQKVKVIIIFSGLLGVCWLTCVGWAVMEYSRGEASVITNSSEKPIEKRSNQFILVALGDSLTRGTGDETGKGYVGMVKEKLEKKFNQKIIVQNLGIKGLVSAELAEQIKEPEVRRQLQAADAILITIGGNDLFQQGDALLQLNQKSISEIKTNYKVNLDKMVNDIRQVNSSAKLFVLGLYNPFIQLDKKGEMNAVVRQWNNDTAEVLANYKDVVFVPTFDLFQLSANDYLYSDKFHPNRAGYQLMAERIVPLIDWEVRKDE